MMEAVGFSKNVMVFENGEKALQYLKPIMTNEEALPNIILLDINMPVVDGWTFLDEFTKIRTNESQKVTILMMSSSVNPVDLEKAKTYEAISDYIVKPVDKNKLASIMQSFSDKG